MAGYTSKGSEAQLIEHINAIPASLITPMARVQLINEILAGQGRDAYESASWVIERATPGKTDDRWWIEDWNHFVAQGMKLTVCAACDDVPALYDYQLAMPRIAHDCQTVRVCGDCYRAVNRDSNPQEIRVCPICAKVRVFMFDVRDVCFQCDMARMSEVRQGLSYEQMWPACRLVRALLGQASGLDAYVGLVLAEYAMTPAIRAHVLAWSRSTRYLLEEDRARFAVLVG